MGLVYRFYLDQIAAPTRGSSSARDGSSEGIRRPSLPRRGGVPLSLLRGWFFGSRLLASVTPPFTGRLPNVLSSPPVHGMATRGEDSPFPLSHVRVLGPIERRK